MGARTVTAPAAPPSLGLFGSPPESLGAGNLRGDPPPLTASRRAAAFPGLPVGHPMREREMVCDLADELVHCPVSTGALGPLDVCRRRIGTIGYQLGGVVVCWSCFVRAVASERAAAKEAATELKEAATELAEVGGLLGAAARPE